MQSPPIEWTLAGGYIAALNLLRNQGEADNDTISETIRNVVEKIPHGEAWFTLGLIAAGIGFRRHIIGPLHAPSRFELTIDCHDPLSGPLSRDYLIRLLPRSDHAR